MLSVSIIIPTLNSQRTLEECLKSISTQTYKGKKEIIIADGGSSDKTLSIAKKYKTKIIKNKLKTAEAGKAVGARASQYEILAFIDSDNILPQKDWLEKMVVPLKKNKNIIASEPLYFTYRKNDSFLTRYFALLGMSDPLNLFIGNYDRYSEVSQKWTNLKINYLDKGGYLVLNLRKQVPTIGANGFLIRKKILIQNINKDYFFDVDLVKYLADKSTVKVAKVKVGVVHLFTSDISGFIRKQKRRIRDFLFFKKNHIRENNVEDSNVLFGIVKFIFSCLILVPILFQTINTLYKKKDIAILFHPIACWITLLVYSSEVLLFPFRSNTIDRKGWKQ